ncbi:extracellular matrix protein 2-like [Pseudorca crassidens]|uniref:extracellular matrix protein 2-like n=1 Tax=Pseudorca crassidens TaxID=82174 RepID=UPI00352D480D
MVAMQSALLPFLALWAGCCPGGALTRQGPGLREPVLQPASTGLPTLRPLLPSPSGPPDGASQQPSPGGWRRKKDHTRGQGGSGNSETTGRGRKRPGSRQGHGHGLADPGAMEQAMPSLPASCLLAQAAIACGNVKMKHVPALSDPSLTTLYLAENEIAEIPAHAFLGAPNLEWLDLNKNKLDALGLHPDAFKGSASCSHWRWKGSHRLHDGNISLLAFQPLRSLLYLRLDRNRLRTIPPGLPASLQELPWAPTSSRR